MTFDRLLPGWVTPGVLRVARWTAMTVWVLCFALQIVRGGVPYFRSDLLVWLGLGLMAASIGKRNLLTVLVDFVPFALVLIAYDYLRGISDSLGMPTWWHPQLDVDRFLFLGHEPTLWLQEHLRFAEARWWDAAAALIYASFFFLPYVTAAVLWLRSRTDFYRWAARFVAMSFIGFACFALMPAAPPWAAAQCTAADVAEHPYDPPCISVDGAPRDSLLGPLVHQHPGVAPAAERIVGRGFDELHLRFAGSVIRAGQDGVDLVAAVPSLHAGGILLFSMFMWRRVSKWWRPLLVAYPLVMAVSLVYTAEHYVADVLAGWLVAVLVQVVAGRVERRRKARAPVDTLDPCPTPSSSAPPPATTPSSTSRSDAVSSSRPARSTAVPAPHGTTGRSASS